MFHRSRVSPLLRILLLLILTAPQLTGSVVRAQDAPASWQPLYGPGGRLTHLAAGPDGELYMVSVVSVHREADQTQWREAGTPTRSDALYVSRDAGNTWQATTNDLPPGEITALHSDHAGRVWVAIQTRDNNPETRSSLWRSIDQGGAWRQIRLDCQDLVLRTISEDSNQQLLIGAADASHPGGVIFRAGADGASWTSQSVLIPDPHDASARFDQLIPHPRDAQVLFVTTTTGELARSGDGGASWQIVAGVDDNRFGSAQLAFLVDPPDAALLVQSQDAKTSVKQSTDAGATWSEVRTTGLPTDDIVELRSILALPGGVILLNTDAGTYRSADAGRRWQPLEGALSSGFVRAWVGQGRDGQDVLAATDYGLYGSSDSGAIWRGNGTGQPVNSGIVALLTHEDRPTLIAASLRAPDDADPPELLLSRDNGSTWLPADDGDAWRDATAWAVNPGNADHWYVAGPDYVATSKDGALSWTVHPARAMTLEGEARGPIVVAPSDSERIYVGGAPALRSDDGGQSWQELPPSTEHGSGETTALAIDPRDAAQVWSGAADGVHESRDAGQSWQRIGLDGQAVRWLAVTGEGTADAPVVLYAGLAAGGVMRRAASGGNWQAADAGLPPGSVITAFAADPRAPGLLWAARDGGGVYRSTDGGNSWASIGVGLGENLGLALAINYQAPPGSVLLGTATAGVWVLGPSEAPQATETPAGSPMGTPRGDGERAGIDARIEVVWPHDFAAIDQAKLANLGIRLFAPASLEPPACAWQPRVQLWQAVDTEPARPVETTDQRSVDGQPFPYWEANDVDVSAARDGTRKIYFLIAVEGVDTATSVWAHAADARTYFPEQQVPSGIATEAVDAVDARIQIVWPHDETGAEASVDKASLANVAVTLFKHGTRLSIPPDWPGQVTLYGAWNAEVARPLRTEATVTSRQAGVITYPVWEFNDVPVDRAQDPANKLYLWAVAEGMTSYPTIWAHGADARTYFPDQDEPIQGCQP